MAVIGANGAGKSTLLRMIASLLIPTSGSISVDGLNPATHGGEVRQRLGVLSTTTGLYARLTALENLRFFGSLYGLPQPLLTARISELTERLGMSEWVNRRCEKLSTGMRQRVNIARALLHDPAIIILDEPTLGLDLMSTRIVLDFVRECRESGRTILLSTHHLGEVASLCTRIAMINRGTLAYEGPVSGETAESIGDRFFAIAGAP